jgi:uncharacterized protein (TIGR02266 family)
MTHEVDESLDGNRKILIVDDSPMFRDLETLFLARSGRVLTASDGGEALVAARRERPDVVVTDLSMPGMGGDDLCRHLKSDPDLRKIPVIIVTTGADDGEEHARAVRAGADDVIEKPVSRVTLIQAVNHFLRLAIRGLVRVTLETDVRIGFVDHEAWGWSRNVSRGGMFVEADASMEPDTELRLRFSLPDRPAALAPTAKVVWRRPASTTLRPGMGLQFLRLDSSAAQQIDAYVYEHAPPDSGAELMA